MKDNSFEKTERAKHRKKQMKSTKIPKLIFKKNPGYCYGRLKLIRSQSEANLHHVYDTNKKKFLEPKR